MVDNKPVLFQEVNRLHNRIKCRSIRLAIQLWTIGLIFVEHVVDGCKEHSGNGDNRLFVTATLFDSQVTVSDFRMLVGGDNSIGALNQKRLDVSPGFTDPAGFLFAAAFIALRKQALPRSKGVWTRGTRTYPCQFPQSQ